MEMRAWRFDEIGMTHEWGNKKVETHFRRTVHEKSARDRLATRRRDPPANELIRMPSSPAVK